MASNLISDAYVINLHNNPKQQGSESSQVGEQMVVLGRWHTQRGHGRSTPLSHTLPYVPLHLAVHCILYNILYNELVIVSKVFA